MPSINSTPLKATQPSPTTPPEQTTTPETSSASQLHGDIFGAIMSNLSPNDRATSRGVSAQWNRWLNEGLGVAHQVKIPSLPRKDLRKFFSSAEVKHARTIDARNYRRFVLTDADLDYLAPSGKVKAIDLRMHMHLGSKALEILSTRFPNLEYLSLHGCDPVVLSGLPTLGENSKNLKRIALSHRGGVGCTPINAFLRQSGGQLESLCIYWGGLWLEGKPAPRSCYLRNWPPRDALSGVVAASCPGLKRLALPGHHNLTDHQLDQIIKGCPELTTLHLCVEKLSPEYVDQLLESCPTLNFLFHHTPFSYTKRKAEWSALENKYARMVCQQSFESWRNDELARS